MIINLLAKIMIAVLAHVPGMQWPTLGRTALQTGFSTRVRWLAAQVLASPNHDRVFPRGRLGALQAEIRASALTPATSNGVFASATPQELSIRFA